MHLVTSEVLLAVIIMPAEARYYRKIRFEISCLLVLHTRDNSHNGKLQRGNDYQFSSHLNRVIKYCI